MAIMTIQSNANRFSGTKITHYSLMMGGLNVTRGSLAQYDPLVTGFWRLFMVRRPAAINAYYKKDDHNRFTYFKHILEYGNTGVSGIGGYELETDEIRGGYANRSFQVPKTVSDQTSSFTVKVPEFSGSPMREVLHTWINAISDTQTGLSHYNGLIATGEYKYKQANHTAEFIYVVTDRTGMKVEYAAHLCNCFPKTIPTDHFNSESGDHTLAQFDIEFNCTKYEGVDVNAKAEKLLSKFQVMVNSLEYCTGLTEDHLNKVRNLTAPDATSGNATMGYNAKDGKLHPMYNGRFYDYGKDGQVLEGTKYGVDLTSKSDLSYTYVDDGSTTMPSYTAAGADRPEAT